MENFFKFAPDTGADGSAAAAANAGVDIEAKAKADGSTSTKTKIDPAANANKKQPINKIFVSAKAGSGIWKLIVGFLVGIAFMLSAYFIALRGNKLDGDLSEAFKVIDGSVVSVQSLADENIAAANGIEKDQNNILASVDKAKKDLDQIAANATSSKQKAAEVKKNSQQQKEEAKTIKQEAEKVEAAIKQEDGLFKVTTKTPGNVAAKEFSASGSGAGVDTSNVFNTPVTEIYNSLDKDLYVIFYGDWDGGMMAKIAPGQALKPGFKFENGKTFRPGVHFSVFSLDNVKKDGSAVSYDLNDLFTFDQKVNAWRPSNTSLGTYYWASGSITVRDGYYKSAMSILAADGKIYDGVAIKRANGTTKAIKSGGVTIAALNM